MRARRSEIEGRPGHTAVLRGAEGRGVLSGQICADLARTGTTRTCDPGDPEAIRKFARGLHRSLEGFEGTCGDVAEYEVILQHFAD